MRQIGKLESQLHADRLSNFLLTKGISASTEEDNGQWAVWVRDEDKLATARDEFQQFMQNPDATRYREATAKADHMRREKDKARRLAAKNQIDVRQQIWGPPQAKRIPLTITMIVVCVVVALMSGFGEQRRAAPIRQLMFRDPVLTQPLGAPDELGGFDDIRSGQVWRLFTPIFIHYGTIHILFNMLMFYPLAGRIESRRGTLLFALIVLIIAGISNCAEYLISGHTTFGGMSGVVYGLFGFIWMRMLRHPEEGLRVDQQLIVVLLVWLVMGFTGALRYFGVEIANWVHLFGLLSGMALGWSLPTRFWNR